MLNTTLSRYFGSHFLKSVLATFVGVVALAAMIDYVELLRRGSDWPHATSWLLAQVSLFRVPPARRTHHAVHGANRATMSCYLTLSRRLELVVARSAGVSAWQFVAPAMVAAFLFGTLATVIYNPVAALLHERSKPPRSRADRRTSFLGNAGEHQRILGATKESGWRGHH